MISYAPKLTYLTLFKALVETGDDWWFEVWKPSLSGGLPSIILPSCGCFLFSLSMNSLNKNDVCSLAVHAATLEIRRHVQSSRNFFSSDVVPSSTGIMFKIPLNVDFNIWPGMRYITSQNPVAEALNTWQLEMESPLEPDVEDHSWPAG